VHQRGDLGLTDRFGVGALEVAAHQVDPFPGHRARCCGVPGAGDRCGGDLGQFVEGGQQFDGPQATVEVGERCERVSELDGLRVEAQAVGGPAQQLIDVAELGQEEEALPQELVPELRDDGARVAVGLVRSVGVGQVRSEQHQVTRAEGLGRGPDVTGAAAGHDQGQLELAMGVPPEVEGRLGPYEALERRTVRRPRLLMARLHDCHATRRPCSRHTIGSR